MSNLRTKKKLLIVGGTGFIGYHLALGALKKNWSVTSISTNKPKKIRNLNKVKYIHCDIRRPKTLKKIIKKDFDYVVNLGGYVNHDDKKKTMDSHFTGCKNLTDIFREKKIYSFVQLGSSVEYGSSSSPQKESKKINHQSLKSTYGKAKLLSSNYLINLFKRKNFPVTILRLYLAYGPRQDLNRLIPIVIDSCLKNKKFSCSPGLQMRDFVYIDDVINAIFLSIKSKKSKGQIINIGSGKPKKIKRIIELIKKTLKKGKPQYGKIKLRKDEILKIYSNAQKSKKILNWVPRININNGLKKTINYYKKLYDAR